MPTLPLFIGVLIPLCYSVLIISSADNWLRGGLDEIRICVLYHAGISDVDACRGIKGATAFFRSSKM